MNKNCIYIIISLLFSTSVFSIDLSFKTKDAQDTIIDWTTGKISITVKERIPKVINDVNDPLYGKNNNAFNVSESRNKSYKKAKDSINIKLARAVETLLLDDRSSILDKINTDEKFRERFNEFYLLDHESIHIKYVEDSVQINSGISITGKDGIMNFIDMEFGKEQFPEFNEPGYPSEYTGLIVDARHLDVKPTLLPRISTDKGLDVYSYHFVNKNYAIDKSLVSYQKDPVVAMTDKRIGSKPYFVIAQSVYGANKTNLSIPTEDAIKLLGHKNTKVNLKMCRVIILLSE